MQAGNDWQFSDDKQSLTAPSLIQGNPPNNFTFDRVLDSDSTQLEAYNSIAKDTVQQLLKGFNGTIFAYG